MLKVPNLGDLELPNILNMVKFQCNKKGVAGIYKEDAIFVLVKFWKIVDCKL